MIYSFDPRSDPRWERFVQRHPAASVFCTAGWLEALARTYRYRSVAYTTSAPSAPLANAVVFCQVDSWLTGSRLVALPFSDYCDALITSEEDRTELVAGLRREVDAGRYRHIEFRPVTSRIGGGGLHANKRFVLHELDLRPPLSNLFGSFHVNAVQQMVRRAEREGLQYVEGRSEELLREFYDLMVLTRRRHQLPPAPLVWFRNLLACLPEHAILRLAFKENRAVAAIFTLAFGRTVTYKYGCSDANNHKLGGIAMLLWRVIQEAKSQNMETLDFGRSDLDNPGLITFKERWGAKPRSLIYYRYPSPAAHTARPWVDSLIRRLLRVAPNRFLITAGNVFYRHIG
jgi:hypothetical protein